MASIQSKVIHRFIRPISEYERGGSYYTQVIPLDTQAYAIYPAEAEKVGLWYVLGDGDHTYTEIRDGKGNKESAKEYPVFSEENSYSKAEIDSILKELHQFNVVILDELPEEGDSSTFYLINKKTEEDVTKTEENQYDEYLWIGDRFELIGTTGNFLTKKDLVASNVQYTNINFAAITNVQEALDYLLYAKPEVRLYGGETYEKGYCCECVDLWWEVNKEVTTQYINNGVGTIDCTLRNLSIEDANIEDDTTFTITVSDGKNKASASTKISFAQKIYWGVSANTELSQEEILNFDNEFENVTENTCVFNCSGGKYFYIVAPAKYHNDFMFRINGFIFSDMEETSLMLKNASGYEDEYIVYRSNNIQTGSTIEVEYVI